MSATGEALVQTRRMAALEAALGPAIGGALGDPSVVEILINADGIMRVDRIGEGICPTEFALSVSERETAIRLLATEAGASVTTDHPHLSTILPNSGARVQALTPPLTGAPVLSIRKRPQKIFPLSSYVEAGIATEAQAAHLRRAIAARRNIAVAGGTGSGKTTLLNALLAEPEFQSARIVLLEDTVELQCAAPDHVQLLTRAAEPAIQMRDLVRMTLRLRPDRIVVGEVRDGAALDVLKAWNTGHPGGLLSLHANSALEALGRLEDLCAEVSVLPARRLVLAAVDLVVFIANDRGARRIAEILDVAALRGAPPASASKRVPYAETAIGCASCAVAADAGAAADPALNGASSFGPSTSSQTTSCSATGDQR